MCHAERSEGVRTSFPNGPQGHQNYNGLNTPAGAFTISQLNRSAQFSWAVVAQPRHGASQAGRRGFESRLPLHFFNKLQKIVTPEQLLNEVAEWRTSSKFLIWRCELRDQCRTMRWHSDCSPDARTPCDIQVPDHTEETRRRWDARGYVRPALGGEFRAMSYCVKTG